MKRRLVNKGFLLLETVIAIAVITILTVAISRGISQSLAQSTDPQIRLQGLLLAESQLESILATDFYDADTGTVCPTPEASYAEYDNICDFHSPTATTPTNSLGTPITGLEAYRISTTIDASGLVEVGGLTGTSAGLPVWIKITVRVTAPPNLDLTLSTYVSSPRLSN